MALLLLPAFAAAQTIKGKVLDEAGLPLPGVSIANTVSGANTITDLDGNFAIAANAGDNLNFSFIGYLDQSVVASADMSVRMQVSSTELQEVVVNIGYGTARKRDLTGSIVKVSGREVADKPNTNAVASLQGKVAGLSVIGNGQLGEEPDVRIRGTISRYKTKPLYVVDGVFLDNMSFVNPSDIQSIEVLKDASSLAVFGNLGANGVIIVTTKRAATGKTTINLSTYTGIKSVTGKPNMTNGSQFRTLYDQQRANEGAAPYAYYNLFNANTDWVDEISEASPIIQQYNVSVANSTESNNFYLGASYTKEEGLIINELYKKFTMTVNDELKIGKRFKVGINMNGYDARHPQLHTYTSALNATPIVEPFNEEHGLYNQLPSDIGGAQIGNPLAANEMFAGTQLGRSTRFVGNLYAEGEILNGLTLRGSYLADLNFYQNRGYTPVFDVYNAEADQTTLYSGNALTKVNQTKYDQQQLQQNILLTYDKTFGKHDFTALLGYERRELTFSSLSGSVSQYAEGDQIPNDPRWWYLNVYPYGDPTTRLANSEQYDNASVSYLGRVLYNYDGKYLLNTSFRRDGSSDLGGKFQNFWAVGAGWELSRESFMTNQKIFDYLKLKGSVGQLGNQYTSLHYADSPNYVEGSTAVFGENLVPAYVLAYRNNPDLKWETVTSIEGGIEFKTLSNRLSVEANYFSKETEDMLTEVVTTTNSYYKNAGGFTSKGFEFLASWNDKVGDFTYGLSANFTTLSNKVTNITVSDDDTIDYLINEPTILAAGVPIGAFYGYVVEGVYQSYADILSAPPSTLGNYDVGDLKYKDVNGDGQITPDDRQVIGKPTPDVTYGASLNLGYKNFSLSVDIQGVYGNEVYRDWGNGSTYAQFNYRSARLNAWNGAGTSNWEPRLNDATGYNRLPSTYMIEDGSYVRLRNIQLAYDFAPELIKELHISNLRIYVNAQNPVTWKHNSGFSPESGGSPIRFGIDTGGYPVPAITTIGLNATF